MYVHNYHHLLRLYNYIASFQTSGNTLSYGHLKARWCSLLRRNDMNIDNIPYVIIAACVLHNICEVHYENFNDAWLQTGGEYAQPDAVASRDIPT